MSVYTQTSAVYIYEDAESSWGEPERVLQLSRENEREVLLTDCRVGVKESESEDAPS